MDRPDRSRFQLRTISVVVTIALGLLVVVSAALIFVMSARARQGMHERDAAAEDMRVAETARVALLRYSSASDIAFLTKSPAAEDQRLKSETAVLTSLAEVRKRAVSEEPRAAVSEADGKTNAYLLARRKAEATQPSIREVILASSGALDAAVDSVGSLAGLALRRLEQINAAARSRIEQRDWIGSISRAVVLAAVLAWLFAVRRVVIQPLFNIGEAIRAFSHGDRKTRATERGPAELRETAHMFNQMADHLVRQEEQRLTFLAGVAHDLRNPLSALRMSAHLVRPGAPLPNEEKIRTMMTLVDRQVTRLERMVADFLDATRIEGGHLELRLALHDLRRLVAEAVQLYSETSHSHQLSLRSPEEEVPVRCDATRIEQVLNNLLSNAIKYSPNGGAVSVAIFREGELAIIEVADHGIGIAHDELEHVFDPFRRSGESRGTIPGIGLGLWVSRRIIEAHGGSIEVESELGVGSTFRVRLPLARRVAPHEGVTA